MNLQNFINMDGNILVSMINMKLRDEFEDLNDLCGFYNIDCLTLKEKLKNSGFEYNEGVRQFR